MTWFAIIFSILTTALLAVLLYAIPSVVSRTLPLGVSVPQARTGEPVIASSVRKFRLWVVTSLVVSIFLAVVLSLVAPAAGVIAPVLVFTALGMGSYVVARRSIMHAKREGGWFNDIPVRLTADVTVPKSLIPVPFWWYIAAVVPLVIATGIGVAFYPSLPNPLPIHWGANGVADGYAEKSVWSAFAPVLVGFGLVALMFGLAFLIRVSSPRRIASDSPELAAHRAVTQQKLQGSMLGQITLLAAALVSAIAIFTWTAPSTGWLPIAMTALFLVLIAVVIAVYFVRFQRSFATQPTGAQPTSAQPTMADAVAGSAARQHPSTGATNADAPDDDRFWKAGLFYVNRKDPALMVPKRFGVGWTINMGHPAGIAIGVALLLIIAAAITLPLIFH